MKNLVGTYALYAGIIITLPIAIAADKIQKVQEKQINKFFNGTLSK